MNFVIHWNDAAVQSSMIGAAGSIITGVIGALCTALIGKMIANRAQLKRHLLIAQDDIAFLLKVEEAHCEIHKAHGFHADKVAVRKEVSEKMGIRFSGKFTPGRVSYNDGPGRRYMQS